jgi:tRNA threonylcarbamoyladenosine biosynthesis protein TsaB
VPSQSVSERHGLRTRTSRRQAEPSGGSLLLAIDTTHEFGSLALLRGSETVEEVLLHAPTGFAHVLYPKLSQLLDRHAVSIGSIDCFAAASGPGSFTGVRVGLACVKGLAEALGKPAIAVSNLQAVATFAFGDMRAAVIDARRGDIYGAVYDWALREVTPEVVAKFPAWLDTLPVGDPVFVSTDFTPFHGALAGTRFEKAPVVTASPALAGAVGKLAAARYLAGERTDPAALDANYVRRSDAELFWKE